MPSVHEYSNSSGAPHFLNQAPPKAQQLCPPDLGFTPHLGHVRISRAVIVAVVVVVAFLVVVQSMKNNVGARVSISVVVAGK